MTRKNITKQEAKARLQLQRDLKFFAPTWNTSRIISRRSKRALCKYPLHCPLCKSPYLIRYGFHAHSGEQKYKCKFCNYQFTLSSNRPIRRFENAPRALEKMREMREKQIVY